MDLKEIQELLRMISKSDLSEVEIERKDFRIRIKKGGDPVVVSQYAMPQQMMAAPPTQLLAAEARPAQEAKPSAEVNDKLYTFRSPMIGTFYRTPSPEKPSFINVGDTVTPGKKLCIIEAMKLFNEIECDVPGKIVKILVENAQPVEYDQPLFLIEKD